MRSEQRHRANQQACAPTLFAVTALVRGVRAGLLTVSLGASALFTSCGVPVLATPAIEATQLDLVALDSSVECNRILFQSSQHFKRTIFAMPRVVPGTGIEGDLVYDMSSADRAGLYHLNLRLYFPANDEVIKGSAASTYKRDLQACDWDAVKYSLNQSIPDPRDQISTIASIPLTSLAVRIPGIRALARIGRSQEESSALDGPSSLSSARSHGKATQNSKGANDDEVNIIDYYGRSLTAHFLINEADRAYFERLIVSPNGVPVEVQLRFQARSRDGSVLARIDTRSLIASFEAQGAIKGLKYLTSAQVTAALKASLNEKSIHMNTQSGSSTSIQSVAEMVLRKVMSELEFSAQPKDGTDGLANKGREGADGQVAVETVLKVLRSQVSGEISYNNFSGPEVATAQTELTYKVDRLNDPNVAEIKVRAGYRDPAAGFTISAGQSITIHAPFWYIDRISYPEYVKYLTLGDIKLLKLGTRFPDILDSRMSIANVAVNGTYMAEGEWKVANLISNFRRYRWRRVTREAERVRSRSGVIPPTEQAMSDLPIAISFSELGDRRFIKLSELLGAGAGNPFFTTFFDRYTGRLILTAKQNLGTIRFASLMEEDRESLRFDEKGVVLEKIEQEVVGPLGRSTMGAPYEMKSDSDPITLQKTILLYVGRPRVLSSSELNALKNCTQDAGAAAQSARVPQGLRHRFDGPAPCVLTRGLRTP